jgi:hypothetical protein
VTEITGAGEDHVGFDGATGPAEIGSAAMVRALRQSGYSELLLKNKTNWLNVPERTIG